MSSSRCPTVQGSLDPSDQVILRPSDSIGRPFASARRIVPDQGCRGDRSPVRRSPCRRVSR